MDKDKILNEIRRIAKEKKTDTISKSEFKQKSGISEWQVYKYFDSWNEAIKIAGLIPTDTSKIGDDELFQEMKEVFIKCNGICSQMKFDKECKFSIKVYRKRFGRWNGILSAFKKWIEDTGEEVPFLNQLKLKDKISSKKSNNFQLEKSPVKQIQRETLGVAAYGPFLNFRGLQHAPINEQGVVFLFGMVCFELGFAVEAIRTAYPDCEAKRKVKGRHTGWERISIEFEYKSSNFKEQGHDPSKCDLLVCWQHDWTDCPIEVLELKSKIKELEE